MSQQNQHISVGLMKLDTITITTLKTDAKENNLLPNDEPVNQIRH